MTRLALWRTVPVVVIATFSTWIAACTPEERAAPQGGTTSPPVSIDGTRACPDEVQRECADFQGAARNVIDSVVIYTNVLPEFFRDPDGTLRYQVTDALVIASAASWIGALHDTFEVNRWEELPAGPNDVHYQGPCYTYEGEHPRTIACEAIISFRTEGDLTYMNATLLGRIVMTPTTATGG